MYLWYGDSIGIYTRIYLTTELINDLHNSGYHRVGDTDASKQRMEVELIE